MKVNKKIDLTEVTERVWRFIREQNLIPEKQRLLVAVSGGPDSVCLLHILFELQAKLGTKLHIAHLNHLLRGADSDADARYVTELARQLDIPATIDRRDVKDYQAKQRLSPEEAAREVRYAFLTQVADSIGTDRVAVGHTVDDHIETILMHLIRGTGTRGLRGLRPLSNWQSSGKTLHLIRPLLPISRQQTADYCSQLQLKPRFDASNLSLSPLRNRIRRQLLPLLQSYNPQVTEALLRTACITTDDTAFLDEAANHLCDDIVREDRGTLILNKVRLLQLPSAMKRYLLRNSIEKALGTLKDIETRHIEEILAALNKPAGKKISLPEGLTFSIEYDRYLLGRDSAALSPFPVLGAEFTLKIPGETKLPGGRIAAKIIERAEMKEKDDGFTAYLDLAKTGSNLIVRTRQSGDRFQPLGMSQPKKLNEFMIDSKIPSAWRGRIPLVCSPGQIIWVVGWRIDERVRVAEETKKVLRLEFKQV